MVGNMLLVAIEHGAAPAGFAVSLMLIAIGSGGFQSTISAFIGKTSDMLSYDQSLTKCFQGDQYVEAGQGLITRKNGAVYMPDRDLTLQFVYNLNYWYEPRIPHRCLY